MGEAKRRGTLEQRVSSVKDRDEARETARVQKNLDKLYVMWDEAWIKWKYNGVESARSARLLEYYASALLRLSFEKSYILPDKIAEQIVEIQLYANRPREPIQLVGSSAHVEISSKHDQPFKVDKGQFNGACNRRACQEYGGVVWWNRGTRHYYCRGCARMINESNHDLSCLSEEERAAGNTLCIVHTEEQSIKVPSQVTENGNPYWS